MLPKDCKVQSVPRFCLFDHETDNLRGWNSKITHPQSSQSIRSNSLRNDLFGDEDNAVESTRKDSRGERSHYSLIKYKWCCSRDWRVSERVTELWSYENSEGRNDSNPGNLANESIKRRRKKWKEVEVADRAGSPWFGVDEYHQSGPANSKENWLIDFYKVQRK